MFSLSVLLITIVLIPSPVFGQDKQAPRYELCSCPSLSFEPVCASNGETYANDCRLKCAMKSDPSLTLKSNGFCEKTVLPPPESEECSCDKSFSLRCGSNGKKYTNQCRFDCAQKANPGLEAVSCKKQA